MFFFEFVIISTLILFQSIFGLGLLIFGTPIFLLMGYNFLDILNILIPISITINTIQFFSTNIKIKKFIYNFNFFCLPLLIISLYFMINYYEKINLELLISILIILFSILSLKKKKIKYLKNFTLLKQKIFLSIIGVVHGLSNLGGALLAILSSTINVEDKNKTRICIAYAYLIMGIIQILAINLFTYSNVKAVHIPYIALVFLIYFPAQKIFNKFESESFAKFVNIIAFFFGVIILVKSVFKLYV
jgi:hypothetical protein